MNLHRISISNILWPKGKSNLETFFFNLHNNGINAVELALNCFWDEPTSIDDQEILWLNKLLKKYKIELCSIQSITHTRPDLELFKDKHSLNNVINYIKKYSNITKKLECKNIVLGSPKSRITYNKNKNNLDKIFKDFLREIDPFFEGVNFNIEPLSKKYCNYLNSYIEGVS